MEGQLKNTPDQQELMNPSDPGSAELSKPELLDILATSQPAAVRVFAYRVTGELPSVMSVRSRSGGARANNIWNGKSDRGGLPLEQFLVAIKRIQLYSATCLWQAE